LGDVYITFHVFVPLHHVTIVLGLCSQVELEYGARGYSRYSHRIVAALYERPNFNA